MTYGTIVADCPWRYTKNPTPIRSGGRGASAEHLYPTMSLDALEALPIEALAAPEAHLYFWVTNPILLECRKFGSSASPLSIIRAWGFVPMTMLTWVKVGDDGTPIRGGTGWYFRGATEHVIFATRGGLGIPAADRLPNVFLAPRGEHSRKPEVLMDIAEAVSPGPRLELFARRQRLGWDTAGNESLGHVDLGATPA